MNADAILSVRFRTPEEGGRKTSVGGDHYSCPFVIGDGAFDCRIFLEGRTLELGRTYEVPVRFLNANMVGPLLREGLTFALWEGKLIADGVVLSVTRAQDGDLA